MRITRRYWPTSSHVDGGVDGQRDPYPFRLLCRRMAHVVNSSYNARVAGGHPGPNPAFMNSADLTDLGVAKGEEIEIESPTARSWHWPTSTTASAPARSR